MSNSGKSAVGPAEYRLTLSNRRSSTSCFPSALNASFTNLGQYIAPAIISFRPINRTRRFSLSVFSCLQCCQPRAARRPSRSSTHKSPLVVITSRRQTPVDTSDPAPSVPFHHSAILASAQVSALTAIQRGFTISCCVNAVAHRSNAVHSIASTSANLLCLFSSVVQTMPPSSQPGSVVDSTHKCSSTFGFSCLSSALA